jgi:hypothetical protein
VSDRVYNTDGYRKHKQPKGWGSLCPNDLPESPQDLLATGVQVGPAVFNVSGGYALRAQMHLEGRWHGHPIPWERLPTEAKKELIRRGRLTSEEYRKAVRQGSGSEVK